MLDAELCGVWVVVERLAHQLFGGDDASGSVEGVHEMDVGVAFCVGLDFGHDELEQWRGDFVLEIDRTHGVAKHVQVLVLDDDELFHQLPQKSQFPIRLRCFTLGAVGGCLLGRLVLQIPELELARDLFCESRGEFNQDQSLRSLSREVHHGPKSVQESLHKGIVL